MKVIYPWSINDSIIIHTSCSSAKTALPSDIHTNNIFSSKIESMQDLHERERQALHQRYSSSEMTRQELDSNLSGMKNENTELHYEIKYV